MVLAFAERGADVVIASRKLPACEEVAREVVKLGRKALPFACHVGRWDEVGKLADAAYERFGKVDVLINNAGMSPLYPSLEEISEELFDKVVGLNFKGPFRLSAIVGSRMAKGDGGSIINISSTASLNPSPTSEPYGAAKAGLNSITRSFAFAYGPEVRVNCIVAGPFLTDIAKAWDMEAFETLGAAAGAEARRRAQRNRRRGAVSGESVGEFHQRHSGSRRRRDAVNKFRAWRRPNRDRAARLKRR